MGLFTEESDYDDFKVKPEKMNEVKITEKEVEKIGFYHDRDKILPEVVSNSAFKATMATMIILIVLGLFFLAIHSFGAVVLFYTAIGGVVALGIVYVWLSLYEHYENK